jgi:hypothetical protein
MVLSNHAEKQADIQGGKLTRVRLAGELSNGHCRTGELVKLSEIAAKYQLNEDAVLNIFIFNWLHTSCTGRPFVGAKVCRTAVGFHFDE